MFVLGTAGHIDHGKSVLVRALTGIDPDRLREEKERGMTIDLGFAWLKLPSGQCGDYDATLVIVATISCLNFRRSWLKKENKAIRPSHCHL